MENHLDKTTAAVIVDYDYYRENERVRDFVEKRKANASMVAFVSTPEAYSPDDYPDEDWDVIIVNYKSGPDEKFKDDALHALSRLSNLYPAITIDRFNEEAYRTAGGLMHLGGWYFG